jgi:pimeloyl-ACP methyl ester carboxylesterase
VLKEQSARLDAAGVWIDADISIPPDAAGMVLFVHGSGSSRNSPRNRFVADRLQAHGLATVLMDLMTPAEERADQFTGQLRFDIPFLTRRVVAAVEAVTGQWRMPLGLFGASTGAAAALVVAAAKPGQIRTVVSRGGRPDMAGDSLPAVQTPTLLIVGAEDREVLELNRQAMARMKADVKLEIVPGASHLFHEPGALEAVADRAAEWFGTHLTDGR